MNIREPMSLGSRVGRGLMSKPAGRWLIFQDALFGANMAVSNGTAAFNTTELALSLSSAAVIHFSALTQAVLGNYYDVELDVKPAGNTALIDIIGCFSVTTGTTITGIAGRVESRTSSQNAIVSWAAGSGTILASPFAHRHQYAASIDWIPVVFARRGQFFSIRDRAGGMIASAACNTSTAGSLGIYVSAGTMYARNLKVYRYESNPIE